MNLLKISPFVRIALRYSLIQKPINSYSLDNRLFYIRKGEGYIYLNGEQHPIRPDTLFLWQKGTAYRFDFKTPNDVITLNFDYTADNSDIDDPLPIIFDTEENKGRIAKIKPIVFEDCPELNQPIILYNAVNLFPAIKEILKFNDEMGAYTQVTVSAKVKMLIAEVLKEVSSDEIPHDVTAKVQRVLSYIKSNYKDDLDNETIAEQVGYHPYYINNIVKSVTGMSLHKHLINYRLTVAERLLLSTDATITDIAENVGFSSTMVFIRNFKLKNNVTPNKYREKTRETI